MSIGQLLRISLKILTATQTLRLSVFLDYLARSHSQTNLLMNVNHVQKKMNIVANKTILSLTILTST